MRVRPSWWHRPASQSDPTDSRAPTHGSSRLDGASSRITVCGAVFFGEPRVGEPGLRARRPARLSSSRYRTASRHARRASVRGSASRSSRYTVPHTSVTIWSTSSTGTARPERRPSRRSCTPSVPSASYRSRHRRNVRSVTPTSPPPPPSTTPDIVVAHAALQIASVAPTVGHSPVSGWPSVKGPP